MTVTRKKILPALHQSDKVSKPDLQKIGDQNYTDTILRYGNLAIKHPQLNTNAKTIVDAINELYHTKSTVIPNPPDTPTDNLYTVKIDGDTYRISGGSTVIPNPPVPISGVIITEDGQIIITEAGDRLIPEQDDPSPVLPKLYTIGIDGEIYEVAGGSSGIEYYPGRGIFFSDEITEEFYTVAPQESGSGAGLSYTTCPLKYRADTTYRNPVTICHPIRGQCNGGEYDPITNSVLVSCRDYVPEGTLIQIKYTANIAEANSINAEAGRKSSTYTHIQFITDYMSPKDSWKSTGTYIDGNLVQVSQAITDPPYRCFSWGQLVISGIQDITLSVKQDSINTNTAYILISNPGQTFRVKTTDTFNGDGVTNIFTLSHEVYRPAMAPMVSFEPQGSYPNTVSGNTITFTERIPPVGTKISVQYYYIDMNPSKIYKSYKGVTTADYDSSYISLGDSSQLYERIIDIVYVKDGDSTISDSVAYFYYEAGTPYFGGNGEIFNDYGNNYAIGFQSHAEGGSSLAMGNRSHAECMSKAIGSFSHSEGDRALASGNISHAEGNSTVASGWSSHSEGDQTIADGQTSHAEGNHTQALGNHSHAEGETSVASGQSSHAEGEASVASGQSSHAEGNLSKALNSCAHAEGNSTTAQAPSSHAEGSSTNALGTSSHAEGDTTTASGDMSHAEGDDSIASGESSHAEGAVTTASGKYSHAEGNATVASNYGAHAEGQSSIASGQYSHAEGNNTEATYDFAHAEGQYTDAFAVASHAEGGYSKTEGQYAHAEGEWTTSSGQASHSEGQQTTASADEAHAEGTRTIASGQQSHAEGYYNTTAGSHSHVEGEHNIITSSGYNAHAEGEYNEASQESVHVEGEHNSATGRASHVFGKYNIEDDTDTSSGPGYGKYVEIVGNGTGDNARSNARTLDWDGNEYVAGRITVGLAPLAGMDVATKKYVDDHGGGGGGGLPSIKAGTGIAAELFNQMDEYNESTASGDYSHAEGVVTEASAEGAHAEGSHTTASGQHSHAEGSTTTASGAFSHSEGCNNTASGYAAHTEGNSTTASGAMSHAEGLNSIANNTATHAEGHDTKATAYGAHAEGGGCYAYGQESHAEGGGTRVYGNWSHAEGAGTIAYNSYSHVEGSGLKSLGMFSHAEGAGNFVVASNSHIEGSGNITTNSAFSSHTEGSGNTNFGHQAHIEGSGNYLSGEESHMEGAGNKGYGPKVHVEGGGNAVSGLGVHAEGKHNLVIGFAHHAEGTGNLVGVSDPVPEFDYTKSYEVGDVVYANSMYLPNSGSGLTSETITGDGTTTKFLLSNPVGFVSEASYYSAGVTYKLPVCTSGNYVVFDEPPANGLSVDIFYEVSNAYLYRCITAPGKITSAISGIDFISNATAWDETTAYPAGSIVTIEGNNASRAYYYCENDVAAGVTPLNWPWYAINDVLSPFIGITSSSSTRYYLSDITTLLGRNNTIIKVSPNVAIPAMWEAIDTPIDNHIEGLGNIAIGNHQHVGGKYNIAYANKAVIIGNGEDNQNRSNAYTLDWNGNATFAGDITLGTPLSTTAQTVAAAINELYQTGGGSQVSVTQKVSTGTNIADIIVDGVTTQLFAPTSGGSNVIVTPVQLSGNHIADIQVDGVTSELYSPEYTPTEVEVTQVQSSGTKIATIEVDGSETDIYAPEAGDSVTVTQITSTGTHIADIEVDGVTTELYAPNAGGAIIDDNDIALDKTWSSYKINSMFHDLAERVAAIERYLWGQPVLTEDGDNRVTEDGDERLLEENEE